MAGLPSGSAQYNGRTMLKTSLCEALGIELPVFLAGMGGVAYANVCAAVSEAGGVKKG